MQNMHHFDEDQEIFCILSIIFFWILSLAFTPLFMLGAVAILFYVVF